MAGPGEEPLVESPIGSPIASPAGSPAGELPTGGSPIVVSADEHLVEPRSFWDEWLPETLPPGDRARAPRLDGVALSLGGASGHHVVRTFLLFPDLVERSDAARGAGDPLERLAVLDEEGIDA
jgi:hypothetical protein